MKAQYLLLKNIYQNNSIIIYLINQGWCGSSFETPISRWTQVPLTRETATIIIKRTKKKKIERGLIAVLCWYHDYFFLYLHQNGGWRPKLQTNGLQMTSGWRLHPLCYGNFFNRWNEGVTASSTDIRLFLHLMVVGGRPSIWNHPKIV